MTEPASMTAMRQLVEEARLRRASGTRRRASAALRPAVQEETHDGEDGGEHQLTDADAGPVTGEPGRHRHQQDGGDAEDEQADEALAARGAGSGGLRG
jgi:hypothetical protein